MDNNHAESPGKQFNRSSPVWASPCRSSPGAKLRIHQVVISHVHLGAGGYFCVHFGPLHLVGLYADHPPAEQYAFCDFLLSLGVVSAGSSLPAD